MIKCKSKNGFDVWVSITYDCEPNLGGYFCQVYIDSECNREVDDFVVPAEVMNAGSDRKFIIQHMKDTDVNALAEWCNNCCDEVVILNKFEVQICPSCGHPICPCCLCDDCIDDCPLDKELRRLEEILDNNVKRKPCK